MHYSLPVLNARLQNKMIHPSKRERLIQSGLPSSVHCPLYIMCPSVSGSQLTSFQAVCLARWFVLLEFLSVGSAVRVETPMGLARQACNDGTMTDGTVKKMSWIVFFAAPPTGISPQARGRTESDHVNKPYSSIRSLPAHISWAFYTLNNIHVQVVTL